MTNFIIQKTIFSELAQDTNKIQNYLKGEINLLNDPFDIDVKTIEMKPNVPQAQWITSKSLCTPGCGKTGTGNSFCC